MRGAAEIGADLGGTAAAAVDGAVEAGKRLGKDAAEMAKAPWRGDGDGERDLP